MAIILTQTPTEDQKRRASEAVLTSTERRNSSQAASFCDGADLYAFYEQDDGTMTAVLSLTEADELLYDCSAFTRPDCRRQGLFTELLDEAFAYLPEDTKLCFRTDGTCADTNAALEAIEAECVQEDHMMELDLRDGSALHLFEGLDPIPYTCEETRIDTFRNRNYISPFGSIQFTFFSNYLCLHSFEIHEEMRGRGYGNRLLCTALLDLADENAGIVRMHVEGDNETALALYKKTGFRITETLFTYLY